MFGLNCVLGFILFFNVINGEIMFLEMQESETTSPTCVKTNVPECLGFNSASNCDNQTWIATATLNDAESGLAMVYTNDNDTELNTTAFAFGTTDDVNATLTASCCIRDAEIVGVDVDGNTGVCSYDLGDLDGVLTFDAIGEGVDWVYLRWTVSEVRPDLYKYSLVTDYGFTNDIPCFQTTCFYNSTGLQPCSLHHFELTPFFDQLNDYALEPGTTAITEDNTNDRIPDAPINGDTSVGSDINVIYLTWDAPIDARCITSYEIFYSSPNGTTYFMSTTNTSATLTGAEPCYVYNMLVKSATDSFLVSESLEINAPSADAAPGEPENLIVYNVTSDSATLSWDEPLLYPQCVANYDLTWIEIEENLSPFEERSMFTIDLDNNETVSAGEFTATVSPLTPCANYSFEVFALSHGGLSGPNAVVYNETEESAPTDPSNLKLEPTGTHSINASWDAGTGICVGHYEVCFEDPVSDTENCTDVAGTSHEFDGLRSCTTYIFSLTAISPDGTQGSTSFSVSATLDDVPGAPQNLTTLNTTSSTVIIEFNPPTENPQCVDQYIIKYIDLNGTNLLRREFDGKQEKAVNTNELTGIESCTSIWIMVSAVSPRGLEGPMANTSATTLEGLPSNPENLQIIETTSTSLTLSWYSPSDNSRCIDHYRIIYVGIFGDSGNEQKSVIPGQYNFKFTLENLFPDAHYNIGVSGMTFLGNQGLSAATEGDTLVA